MFLKKKPKRLYYPTRSRWYTKPKRRSKAHISNKKLTERFKKRFSGFLKNAFYFLLLALFVFMIAGILIFSRYFSIKTIQVIREDFNIDTAEITNQLNSYIARNILFFPKKEMVNTIQENFPEFAFINIKKVFPDKVEVELKSHEIVANLRVYYILPEADISLQEGVTDSVLKIDEALEEAFGFSDEPEKEPEPLEQKCLLNAIGQAICDQEENLELMTIVVDGLTQPIEDREIVIPDDKIEYLLGALAYFKNLFEMQVAKVRYLPIAREIHIITDTDVDIWLTMEKDYKKQIDKLSIIYQPAELDKEDIAYIDLRVKEKVIYCLRRSRCNN